MCAMRKAGVVSVLLVLLLAVAVIAEAQRAKKVHRIGYLSSSSDPASESTRFEAIRRALRELGYEVGSCS